MSIHRVLHVIFTLVFFALPRHGIHCVKNYTKIISSETWQVLEQVMS